MNNSRNIAACSRCLSPTLGANSPGGSPSRMPSGLLFRCDGVSWALFLSPDSAAQPAAGRGRITSGTNS